jgi:hypothetical protein
MGFLVLVMPVSFFRFRVKSYANFPDSAERAKGKAMPSGRAEISACYCGRMFYLVVKGMLRAAVKTPGLSRCREAT